jgi:hypothetical protein
MAFPLQQQQIADFKLNSPQPRLYGFTLAEKCKEIDSIILVQAHAADRKSFQGRAGHDDSIRQDYVLRPQ